MQFMQFCVCKIKHNHYTHGKTTTWVDIKSLFLGNCIDEAGETKAN